MYIEPIKTHVVTSGESLEKLLDQYLKKMAEKTILAITSKIVSVSQGRLVPKNKTSKIDLIRQEADSIFPSNSSFCLTLKDNRLLPCAGIDESNSQNAYILPPSHPQEVARTLWEHVRHQHHLHHFGVLITDSNVSPLRRGVTGIALGWCGFSPLYSYINQPDIYHQPLKVTQINLLDALATSAVLIMGEGQEQTPLALIHDAPKMHFLDRPPTLEEEQSIVIAPEEDLYAACFSGV